jgi:hypothetical protein
VVKKEEEEVRVNRAPPQEDLWNDVRLTSSPAKPPPTTSSAPQAPLPVTNDANKKKRPASSVAGQARDPRLQKKARPRSILKTGERKEEETPPSNNQQQPNSNCLLVHDGLEYRCNLVYTEESLGNDNTAKEINENTANAKEKIVKAAGDDGSGVTKLEVCGLEVLKLGSASGKCSDPFLVLQLACRGLGPAVSLCGDEDNFHQVCMRNFAEKRVMKVHLDGEHKLYLCSLKNLGKDGSRGAPLPGMYGFLVKEDERSGSVRPSLVKNIVLQTMIGQKINVGFDLGILLGGKSLEDLCTKVEMMNHLNKNPLYKFFSDSKRQKFSCIRYYAKKKDTDYLSKYLPRYMAEDLLDMPDNPSDEDVEVSPASYPLTVMFGRSDHNEARHVALMGNFVEDVNKHFYQEVKGSLSDYVNNFFERPEDSFPSLLESQDEFFFDTIVKEKRNKYKIELDASISQAGVGGAGEWADNTGRQEPPPSTYHSDRAQEPSQPHMNHNHMPRANAGPSQTFNRFVETNTVVTQQRVLHTQQQTPYQTKINQPKFADNNNFKNIVNVLDGLPQERLERHLQEIWDWMRNGTLPNQQEQAGHGVQNNSSALVVPAEQNYNQHNQVVAQQGYWQGYKNIDPQESVDAYVSEMKRVFPPHDVYATGGLDYNCIAINNRTEELRYIERLPINESYGMNCLTNKSRLEELLQHVSTKNFVGGRQENCYYNSYCIAMIG